VEGEGCDALKRALCAKGDSTRAISRPTLTYWGPQGRVSPVRGRVPPKYSLAAVCKVHRGRWALVVREVVVDGGRETLARVTGAQTARTAASDRAWSVATVGANVSKKATASKSERPGRRSLRI
jgi:hypothetical protein